MSVNENLKTLAAIGGVFVLVPFTILTYKDAARNIALASPNRPTHTLILGLRLRILGAVSLLGGLAILSWVGYNLLISRQPVFTGVKSLGQLVLPIVLVVAGWRWLRRPFAKPLDDAAA